MCPGSHIRRARGATPGRESPEVQVPGGFGSSESRSVWSRGASNPWGRSIKRIAAASLPCPTKSPLWGVLNANCGSWERRACRRRAKASVCGEAIGRVHPQGSPAYGRWHQGKDRCLKAGKVSTSAKTRPYGEGPAYNRETGSRREGVEIGG